MPILFIPEEEPSEEIKAAVRVVAQWSNEVQMWKREAAERARRAIQEQQEAAMEAQSKPRWYENCGIEREARFPSSLGQLLNASNNAISQSYLQGVAGTSEFGRIVQHGAQR